MMRKVGYSTLLFQTCLEQMLYISCPSNVCMGISLLNVSELHTLTKEATTATIHCGSCRHVCGELMTFLTS